VEPNQVTGFPKVDFAGHREVLCKKGPVFSRFPAHDLVRPLAGLLIVLILDRVPFPLPCLAPPSQLLGLGPSRPGGCLLPAFFNFPCAAPPPLFFSHVSPLDVFPPLLLCWFFTVCPPRSRPFRSLSAFEIPLFFFVRLVPAPVFPP